MNFGIIPVDKATVHPDFFKLSHIGSLLEKYITALRPLLTVWTVWQSASYRAENRKKTRTSTTFSNAESLFCLASAEKLFKQDIVLYLVFQEKN
ncbi:MAG: hypothetical protein RML35_14920 [Chloroherpetonaceae bacterium]|nr:hypothetical protein [Chloroherpetonaceae bacterium]